MMRAIQLGGAVVMCLLSVAAAASPAFSFRDSFVGEWELQRIDQSMQGQDGEQISDEVDIDETAAKYEIQSDAQSAALIGSYINLESPDEGGHSVRIEFDDTDGNIGRFYTAEPDADVDFDATPLFSFDFKPAAPESRLWHSTGSWDPDGTSWYAFVFMGPNHFYLTVTPQDQGARAITVVGKKAGSDAPVAWYIRFGPTIMLVGFMLLRRFLTPGPGAAAAAAGSGAASKDD